MKRFEGNEGKKKKHLREASTKGDLQRPQKSKTQIKISKYN